MECNVLIPMAGEGSRFRKAGFVKPKPFIDVAGKPMISWVVDNLQPVEYNIKLNFIFVIRREHDELYDFKRNLEFTVPGCKIVYAEQLTEGAACTCLLARDAIDSETPLLIANSDQFLEWDSDKFWTQVMTGKETGIEGNILCFKHPMELNDTKWSYAKVDQDYNVVDVQEKVVISDNATVGIYFWSRGANFVNAAMEMIEARTKVKGEYYVAPVYNINIAKNQKVALSFCQKMWGIGVPEDLQVFLAEFVRPRKMQTAAQYLSCLTQLSQFSVPDTSKDFDALKKIVDNLKKLVIISKLGEVQGNSGENSMQSEAGIAQAIKSGCDVMINLWRRSSESENQTTDFWIGQNAPESPIAIEFMLEHSSSLWIKCNNVEAAVELSNYPSLNYFTENESGCVTTSKGYCVVSENPAEWMTGGKVVIACSEPAEYVGREVHAVCCDDAMNILALRQAKLRAAILAMTSHNLQPLCNIHDSQRIRLVVFDLDGVLVESKDLHYEAFNRAIQEVAGESFVIAYEEHLLLYDGLSTNQKLHQLTSLKKMPMDMHQPIWDLKQRYTEKLVESHIKLDPNVCATITALKSVGFPVAVASNCIRQSCVSLLKAIGAFDLIDAFYSNEDVENAKPAGDIYELATRNFGTVPECVAVFEDSEKGFEAAVRSNCNLFPVQNPSDIISTLLLDRITEYEATSLTETCTNIAITMAGSHPRYCVGTGDAVSEIPLTLTEVKGRTAISWILESLQPVPSRVRYIFLVPASVSKSVATSKILMSAVGYARTRVVEITAPTTGAAVTALKARDLIDNDSPLFVFDGNHYLLWQSTGPMQSAKDVVNSACSAVTVFRNRDDRWAYVYADSNADDEVLAVQAKGQVSDLACTGLFFFSKGSEFVTAAETMIRRGGKSRNQYFVAPVVNELISFGHSVRAIKVESSISLRNAQEIKAFASDLFALSGFREQKVIYDEMKARNWANITLNGFRYDEKLRTEVDDRRCMALYTLASEENLRPAKSFGILMQEISKAFSEHVIFWPQVSPQSPKKTLSDFSSDCSHSGRGTLHFTFLQLISFEVLHQVEVCEEYGSVIESVLNRHLAAFEIRFCRIIATPSSLTMVGYPTTDINHVRNELRRQLRGLGLPLMEPFHNNIVHSTLVRFTAPLKAEQKSLIQKIIESDTDQSLATMSIRSMQLSRASWKMTTEELQQEDSREINL